jgi:raw score 9.87
LIILYLTVIFKSIAEKQFQEPQNSDYLLFIEARATQMLRDNKVLSEKGKKELEILRSVVKNHLA